MPVGEVLVFATGFLQKTVGVLVLGLCFTGVFANDNAAHAADIEIINDELCTVRLTGEIVRGDAERLSTAFEGANSLLTLCLDSPGGALDEAVAMADLMLEQFRISTILEADAACLSACALLFMMGHFEEGDTHTTLSRHMHFSSSLGFHRPQLGLTFPDSVNGEMVSSAFDTALDAALGFMRLSATSQGTLRGFIATDLLERAFEAEGDDFFMINTVSRAGRWNIEVFGFEPPESIDLIAALNACNNISTWGSYLDEQPNFSTLAQYVERLRNFPGSSIEDSRFGLNHYFVIGDGAGYDNHSCVVRYDGSNVSMCGSYWFSGFSLNPDGCDGPAAQLVSRPLGWGVEVAPYGRETLALFDPSTRLIDLDGEARVIETRTNAEDLLLGPGELALGGAPEFEPIDECFPDETTFRVGRVEEFVNIRSAAGFSAPLVATAELGSELTLMSASRVRGVGSSAILAQCERACAQREDGDRSPSNLRVVRQCLDDSVLWYQVRTASGVEGYVSGRFLSE